MNIKQTLREIVKAMLRKESLLLKLLCRVINYLPFNNSYKMHRTKLISSMAILSNCKFITERGSVANTIIIKKGCRLIDCIFYIQGNNNSIELGENVSAKSAEFFIEDDGNNIQIGKHTSLCGKIHVACIEGCNINIGEDCMFSSDIVFRTGDSHSIVDMSGKRINPSQDITIGKHVWIGSKVIVNKGVLIANNSIIGTGAIVTQKFESQYVVIAGVPAKIIKENISWLRERIPMD